jgi:hypothetical protein
VEAHASDGESGDGTPPGAKRRLRVNGGLVLVIGAVIAVPALVAGVIALNGGADKERVAPHATTSRAVQPAPPPRPRVYPTYGEYVPPRVVATFTTRAPVPQKTPTATPSPSPRFSCPPDWWRNPWLRRWCHMHRSDTNVP